MQYSLTGNYNAFFVLLSIIVILLASIMMFSISTNMFSVSRRKRFLWLIVGSLTMGLGIFAMHFIGMLAYVMPISVTYSIMTLSISFAIPVLSSFISLLIVSQEKVIKNNYVIGCIIMTISLLSVHYIGMSAIHANTSMTYNPLILLLSGVLALIPSIIYFKLIYDMRLKQRNLFVHNKISIGMLMGLAIVVMHYTSMLGVTYTYDSHVKHIYFKTLDTSQLAILIGMGTIFIITLVLISSFLDSKFTNQSTQLKINEQFYKSLFDGNPEAIVLFDLEGRFEAFNQSVNEFYGYSNEELLLKEFTPLIFPEHLESTLYHFNLAANGTTTNYTTSVFHKNGYLMDLKVKNIPIIVDQKIVGVFGIIKDITDSKRAKDALLEAESKYRSLVEHSLMGVYIYQDNRLVYVNQRIAEILGYNEDEVYKLKLSDYVFEEDIPLVTENISKRLNEQVQSIRYEYRAIRKDGTMAYLEIHGSVSIFRGKNAVIGTVIDITERKRSEETIRYMAYYDDLTGLPNSNFLNEQLNDMIVSRSETAVLLLELERLKTIKDTVGQKTFNSLVILASDRIKQVLDKQDVLTRWQEDKFVILLPNSSRDRVTLAAQDILSALAQPLKTVLHDVYVKPSIGISLHSEDGDSTEKLLDMASSALHYAKKYGNNGFDFYNPDLNGKSRENLEVEMDLHRAVELGELSLHYQPQFNLSTGEYIGNEALIRWHHPTRGMISPLQFIPIAEETGLINSIGEWVLRTACCQNKAWQKAGYPPMMISVNLSSRQFLQTNLVEMVERILAETELDAKYLDLEITESMTMDVERTIHTLQGLKKLGVKISIDDFGTGYSSLYYLKEFPIDRLKIDQSFIRDCHDDPSNATIVKTIISMAHHLDIQVIAEGVEIKEHLDFLQQNLCDEVQGYLLSKPLPAEDLENQFPDLQRIIRKYGLTSEVSHRLWLERELEMARYELQETIRQQDGMTLKYKYKDGKFIHTMCDGELVYRIGLSPEKVIGKELSEILPLEKAKRKEAYYLRAWQGEENVSYEGEENGVVYLASLRPIIRKGKVIEVIASCVDITKLQRIRE